MLDTAEIRIEGRRDEVRRVRAKHKREHQAGNHLIVIDDVARASIAQHATGTIAFDGLQLEDNPLARFYLAVRDWQPESDGIRFSLWITSGGRETQVFERTLTPASHPQDRGWLRQEVSLAEFAGQQVSVTLRADLEKRAKADPGYACWGEPEVVAETTSPTSLPNVVLVSFDTLRADHLGAYGYPGEISPNIDAIAASGAVFENGVSQSSWTRPGHYAMLASRYPGLFMMHYSKEHCRIPSDVVTLAEALKESGYLTAAFAGGGYVKRRSGFEQGFDYFSTYGRRFESHLRPIAGWLENHAQSRFFLFLHNYNAHNPYNPPDDARARFVLDPPAACEGVIFSRTDSKSGKAGKCRRDPGGPSYLRSLYAAEVFHVDRVFGQVVSELKRLGVFDRTIFILTSDHGEELFDHGRFNHISTSYQELIHVPLIMAGPGIPAGERLQDTVQLLDVAPTLLALLGLEAPDDFQGRDLTPLFQESGELRLGQIRLPAFSASSWDPSIKASHMPHTLSAAILDDGRKLIRKIGPSFDVAEIYDVEADPREQRSLEADAVPWGDELDAALKRWLREIPRQDECEDAEMDPAQLEDLRALGYL